MPPTDSTPGDLIPRGSQELSLTRRSTSIAARGLEQSRELMAGKVLTREIAEWFLGWEQAVWQWIDLKEFCSIEDTAAKNLSKYGGPLLLCGLTNLSDAAAESLSKHEALLELDGLTNLSDAAAESLSKHEGGLRLCGLANLSDAAAESLSKHKGGLYLAGLTSLSDEAAKSLGKKEGGLGVHASRLVDKGSGCLLMLILMVVFNWMFLG